MKYKQLKPKKTKITKKTDQKNKEEIALGRKNLKPSNSRTSRGNFYGKKWFPEES